jgi:methylase of polypeptide subunit release factors
MSLFHERALPNLSDNIKCGNSLIASDFSMLPEDLVRVHAFDWPAQFPDAMKAGGFDAIIGNPPYVFTREAMTIREREYYSSRYALGWEKQNTFMLFMERLLNLLKPNGIGSLIVPNSWLTIESAKLLRQSYLQYLVRVVDLNYPAFHGVSMEPSIFIVRGYESTAAVELGAKREFGKKRTLRRI